MIINNLQSFLNIAESISLLLHPHAEVIIFSISDNKVFAVFNKFDSLPGDCRQLIEEDQVWEAESGVFGPFEKTTINGRKLKSISVILEDQFSRAIGLLHINLDITVIDKAYSMLGSFINFGKCNQGKKIEFKEDWVDKINSYIEGYLVEENKILSELSTIEKKMLIRRLYNKGAFKGKKAAIYIGRTLGLGRSTVYKYLNTKN